MLLAIETSCDETAVALLDLQAFFSDKRNPAAALRADLVSSQIQLHAPYGGVVPELAAREHITSLPLLIEQALTEANTAVEDLTAVAVTRGPGLKGCLLVGLQYAKFLAFGRSIPLLALNHLEGHLFACELLQREQQLRYSCLALIVSGGHTMLVLIESFRQYRLVANTRDDSAGEAFDKIASILQLPYPGGPALAELAKKGNPRAYDLPIGMPLHPECFSFSGFKTAVLRVAKSLGDSLEDEAVAADLAASSQEGIVKTLMEKTSSAIEYYQPQALLLSGGVAANELLRERMKSVAERGGIAFCVPPRRWCTDNAAMLAALGGRIIENDPDAYHSWKGNARGRGELGPGVEMQIGALPRWPLSEL